jgi:hypothetical protein
LQQDRNSPCPDTVPDNDIGIGEPPDLDSFLGSDGKCACRLARKLPIRPHAHTPTHQQCNQRTK